MKHRNKEFPLLVTDRLKLRAPDLADGDDLHALLLMPEVTRFSSWPEAPARAHIKRAMKWMCEVHAKGKGCAWIMEDRVSGRYLGAIRFNSIERHSKCAEIGYELHPSAWGKGLMTEAVTAVSRCGFEQFSLNRIEAWTLSGNAASDRVLEKAGFRYEGTLRQKAWFKGVFHDFRMFGLIAGEAPAPSQPG
ncbi:N-acetyltransferase [Rhizobium hidalgonense]|uniref:GNAT family N-acetyltransferase n=1 Tax=Rhizobium hidalgonense TaxID=1538159 RepID=UPI000FEC3702|nr:GNAT family protein [Rhizobium hidalgonense]RWX09073.1 N-acetyltransferase [Rhizobium hidalgonense]